MRLLFLDSDPILSACRHALGVAVSTPNLPQQKAADVLRRVLLRQDHEVAVSLPSASHQKITGITSLSTCKKTQTIQLRFFCEFLQERCLKFGDRSGSC